MKNRQLDVTLQSAGLGVSSIRDLATSVKIVVVPIPADIVAKINNPAYQPATIPADTYDGMTGDTPTVAVPNFLITSESVPDDLVYQMTKTFYEQLDTLKSAHNAAKTIELANALKGMPVPVHPGAERYYKEVGLIK
jgi:TRAP transporter TAXI family solute receptor